MAKEADRPGKECMALRLPQEHYDMLKEYAALRCNTIAGAARELIMRGLIAEGYDVRPEGQRTA